MPSCLIIGSPLLFSTCGLQFVPAYSPASGIPVFPLFHFPVLGISAKLPLFLKYSIFISLGVKIHVDFVSKHASQACVKYVDVLEGQIN